MGDENTAAPQDETTVLETIQEMNALMTDMRNDLANAKSENNN